MKWGRGIEGVRRNWGRHELGWDNALQPVVKQVCVMGLRLWNTGHSGAHRQAPLCLILPLQCPAPEFLGGEENSSTEEEGAATMTGVSGSASLEELDWVSLLDYRLIFNFFYFFFPALKSVYIMEPDSSQAHLWLYFVSPGSHHTWCDLQMVYILEPSGPLWLRMFAGCGRLKLGISASVFSAEIKASLGEYRFYPCYAFFFIFSAMEVSRCKWESGFRKGSHQMGRSLSINGPGPVACCGCWSFSLERGPESAAFPFTLKGLDLVLGH